MTITTEAEMQQAQTTKELYPNLKATQLKGARERLLEAKAAAALKKLPKTIKVDNLSQGSQDILQGFGVEAPDILNDFACALEDVLIEIHQVNKALVEEVRRCHTEMDNLHAARMNAQEDFTAVRNLIQNERWDELKDIARTLGRG